jgi:hypothetical protein
MAGFTRMLLAARPFSLPLLLDSIRSCKFFPSLSSVWLRTAKMGNEADMFPVFIA